MMTQEEKERPITRTSRAWLLQRGLRQGHQWQRLPCLQTGLELDGRSTSLNTINQSKQEIIMAILKNEPLFSFTEGNYAKPHHIIVSGSDEEIGYESSFPRKRKI